MTLWVSKTEPPKDKKNAIRCNDVRKAIELIQERKVTNHSIKHIYVDADLAEKFLIKMANDGDRYFVEILGTPTELTTKLLQVLHWNIPRTDSDVHTLITVIKGNHNLCEGLPDDYQKLPDYLNYVALYMSDKCGIPYTDFYTGSSSLKDIIQSAVMDYMRITDNAVSFVYDYMQAKNTGSDDTYAWCVALRNVYVKDGLGGYVNGFTAENTKDYKRQYAFIA